SDSEECVEALRKIDPMASHWPRPLLNAPHFVRKLDRDKLYGLLQGCAGLEIPATHGVGREELTSMAQSGDLSAVATDLKFPLIVRPRGSHAGVGLVKVDDGASLAQYLAGRPEQAFFVSRFVDYRSEDGLYRKYRVVFIGGMPYACHMAIAARWDICDLKHGV